MDILGANIESSLVFISALLSLLLLVVAAVTAPWHKINDSQAQHVYFGMLLFVFLVWLFKAEIRSGLNYHLLGASLLCLLFEWQFALMGLVVVVAAHTGWQGLGWSGLPLNWLLLAAIPVLFTRMALYFSQRHLPHNFFVYIFLNAFWVAGAAIYLAGAVAGAILYLDGDFTPVALVDEYYLTLMLLIIPEAAMTGMIMTVAVVFRPSWVATFHDRWYLK